MGIDVSKYVSDLGGFPSGQSGTNLPIVDSSAYPVDGALFIRTSDNTIWQFQMSVGDYVQLANTGGGGTFPIVYPIIKTSAAYDIIPATDYIIIADASANNVTINLPGYTHCTDGMIFVIKTLFNSASPAHNITINAGTGTTIEDSTHLNISYAANTPFHAYTLCYYETVWLIITQYS